MGLGAVQTEEFRKSLAGTPNTIFFLKDKQRHWYNDTFEEIIGTLNAKLEMLRIRETVTLGNSMSGFGAIIFAGRLWKCRRAVAFAAQSAVDPSIVPWKRRYDRWTGLDATRLLSRYVRYFVFFGGEEGHDVRHAMRPASARCDTMEVCVLDGCGHEVSLYLKKRQMLIPILGTTVLSDGGYNQWGKILGAVPHRILEERASVCD